jgi:NAD(P)-dependent dehydrogenase (short-subunit alcohol dehydrogenase family)
MNKIGDPALRVTQGPAGTRFSTGCADVSSAGGEETVRLIIDRNGEAAFVHTDVSQSLDVQALMATIIERYGRLDYAHNNAGIGRMSGTHECLEDEWNNVLSINLTGVWLCMKYEIPHMLRHGKGAIVNTASVMGLVGFAGLSAYCASKHGVVGLTKAAALDYAQQGLRINAVCPGWIHTPMIDPEDEGEIVTRQPMGRMGTPEEVAAAVIWLCSDASSFATGLALALDGGWVAQ